ncbi:MAG: FHA domain-containing protein [Clostridiales bacterium]|nr:FHA domain-containing protein [Clostridiales bacterium]
MVAESEQAFQIFRKYDISSVGRVTIGSHPSNFIRYNFMGFISGSHAAIEYTQSGWVLYDTSSNGTFINSRKVSGPRVLQFGDCILMFGLRIVFLGNILAVCESFGREYVTVRGLPEYYPPESGAQPVSQPAEPKRLFKRSPRNLPGVYTDKV